MPPPPDSGHPRRWRILAVLVCCLLSIILDNTVLNVALRTLTDPRHGLGATHSQLEWILSSYTLVFAALLFACGAAADRFGRRRLLLFGLAVFGLASLASAYADSPPTLIITRAVMGVGAAAVMPSTLAVIAAVFPMRERPRAIGVWAGAVGFALAIGPITGGLLLSRFWWGSIFLVNVPLVLGCVVAVLLVVPESRGHPDRGLDLPGVGLSVAGLAALVYGVIAGGRLGTLTDVRVWAPILVGVAALWLFVRHERRAAQPAFELSFLRDPAFSAALAAVGFVSFAMLGFLFFSAFYLQSVRGFSPLRAGSFTLALAAANVVVGPLSAVAVRRHGPRAVCTAGLLSVGAALLGVALVRQHTPPWALVPMFALLGGGMAAVLPAASMSIMTAVPREKAGVSSAMNNTIRQVGNVLGVAVLGSVLASTYRAGVSDELTVLPAAARHDAGESLDATLAAAHVWGGDTDTLVAAARAAFIDAMHLTAVLAAVLALAGAAVTLRWLPRTLPTQEKPTAPIPGRPQRYAVESSPKP
ncbi:MFS transporter [Micromonospora sp. WMMC250]|uniref:MFS transporter n=1 Tax=Micromonospora sp. WMMC250 TaxID=3014781 RepID=UPI0022B6CD8B|nr:MFS transporter [Micromonospora sp. WMMC250]MCZ7375137.1 MFS transporter [Micromonospora sp. WMMC250]